MIEDKLVLGEPDDISKDNPFIMIKELRAENESLHRLLDAQMQISANLSLDNTELRFAREQAEAALGEAVEIIEGLLSIRGSGATCAALSVELSAEQFLQSPSAKAGERVKAAGVKAE